MNQTRTKCLHLCLYLQSCYYGCLDCWCCLGCLRRTSQMDQGRITVPMDLQGYPTEKQKVYSVIRNTGSTFNPLPDMTILGYSNSAANKDLTS